MTGLQTIPIMGGIRMDCNNQTIRYVVAVAALAVMGTSAMIIDGDIGNTIALAVSAGIGYLVKDWRMGGEKNAEEVPQHNSSA